MSRPYRAPALAVVLIGAIACQDYNFNPVGHCLIQPGTKRTTLSGVDTADVLFVVDDSGSMGGEQDKLALAFDRFIDNLGETNVQRVAQNLEPFRYHLAVTTTAVYWNFTTTQTCSTSCSGAVGQAVCCAGATPALQPRRCSGPGDAVCGGLSCLETCAGWLGEFVCCSGPGAAPAFTEVIPCSRVGATCGSLERHYDFAPGTGNCLTTPSRWGSAATGPSGASGNFWPYPHGEFVSWVGGTDPTKPNPRVLHFDEQLYTTGTNGQGFAATALEDYFRQNIKVGTCGSGQEQPLQAARLALQNAQRDTYEASGSPAPVRWDPVRREALAAASWPNRNRDGSLAKTVVVFVGDEDDCSGPEDASGGVVMGAEPTISDACTKDDDAGNPVGGKLFTPASFADYLTNLGRPVAAGFIFPAAETCGREGFPACTPGLCADFSCDPSGHTDVCGAQSVGNRLFSTAQELRGRGVDVVTGSICDPQFDEILDNIAEIVKPPQTFTLPTPPAEGQVTLLRIATPSGDTRKLCGRPLEPRTPTNYTLGEAQSLVGPDGNRYDWWFTATEDPGPPVAVSKYIFRNPLGACNANPGETFSADYLGLVPPPGPGNPTGGCRGATQAEADADCIAKLGGTEGAFVCYEPADDGLTSVEGTCTCRASTL